MEKPEALKAELEKIACDLAKPVPCRRFANQPLAAQVKKISSEVDELWEALAENISAELGLLDQDEAADYAKMAEEAVDIITACRTFLYMIDYTDVEIECVQVKVNIKNRDRGYWRKSERSNA